MKTTDYQPRKRLMHALGQATLQSIEDAIALLGDLPRHEILRQPQTGLVTLRGRIGGGGATFNFGEATVTRASVKLVSGQVGHAYALGRDLRKAELSALVDAAYQHPKYAAEVRANVLEPLEREQATRDRNRAEETAATKVDFFTMVRGDD